MLFSRKSKAETLASEFSGNVSVAHRLRGLDLSAGSWVALGGVIVVTLLAILGPLVVGISPIVPTGDPLLAPGTAGHLLGTDSLGMDVLSRVLAGMRSSLWAAVLVTAVTAIFGSAIGIAAGYLGGWIDNVLMRVTDLFLAFPATIVAMSVAAALQPSMTSSMIGIAVVWWPLYARLVRGEVRRVITSPHVEAARVSGVHGLKLLARHVIPAVSPTVAVTASMDIGGVIMTMSALSYIGLGTPAPAPELGRMASEGMQYVLNAWWIPVFPGLCVGLLALLFNYLGDGLRSLLRSRGF